MAKYIVNVCSNPRSNSIYVMWFDNFLSSINYSIIGLNDVLLKHNAVIIPRPTCIEFETEEDFLIFKLKFN